MWPSKDSVNLNEEFGITITADLLPISPRQLFFFDEQRSFSLKVLMPDGFEQTGGDYHDYIGAELRTGGPVLVTYTLRGKFSKPTKDATFTLLRGPKEVLGTSYFEKKQEISISTYSETTSNNQRARQKAVTDTTCQAVKKSVRLSYTTTSTKKGKTVTITIYIKDSLSAYEYSTDSLIFSSSRTVTPSYQKGFIYIREKTHPTCYRKLPYDVANAPNPNLPTTNLVEDCNADDYPIYISSSSDNICTDDVTDFVGNPQARVAASSSVDLTASFCVGSVIWYNGNGNSLGTTTAGSDNVAHFTIYQPGTYYAWCKPAGCPNNRIYSGTVTINGCPVDPCAANPCACQSNLPSYQWNGQLTWCENGNKYKRLQDVNPCSGSYGLYATGDLLEANTCDCKSHHDVWEWFGATTCDGTDKRKLYINTNECSPNYNVTAPGEVVEYNACECRGTGQQPVVQDEVCDGVNKVRRYRDANECSPTFNQIISTEVIAANSCECRGTGQQPVVQDEVCDGVNKVRRYRDANECSPTFNQIISTEVIAANSCECRGTGQQPEVADEVCDGVNKVRRYRDANECSPSFNQIISTEVIAANSCECRGTGQQPVVQDEVCDGVNKVRRYRDANECSPTFNQIISTEVIGANSCECQGQQPTASISGNLNICSGQSTVLTASAGSTYLWSTGATTASISTALTGPYSVTIDNGAGCLTTASTSVTEMTLSDFPALTARVAGVSTTQSITLTASGCATDQTVRWSGPGGTSATGNIWILPFTQTTTYSARCEAGNGCSGGVATVTATYSNPQAPIIQTSATLLCAGESVTLSANGCSTGQTVQWSSGHTGQTILLTPNATANYTALCAEGQVVSDRSNEIRVTVGNSLSVTGSTSYNVGETISLTALSSAPGSVSYTWSGPAGFTQSGPILQILGAATSQSGSYTVAAQATSSCIGHQVVLITVGGSTHVISTQPLSPSVVCGGASLTVPFSTTGTFTTGNVYTVQLSDATGSFATFTTLGSGTSSPIGVVIPSATASGNYQLRVVSDYPITEGSAPPLTISGVPSLWASSNSPAGQVGVGNALSLSASGQNLSGATYSWSGPATFASTEANPTLPTTSTASNGMYTVVATTPGGCTATAQTSVSLGTACQMSFDGDPVVGCDSTIADSTHRGNITVKLLNQPAGSSLRISLYQQTTLVATLSSSPASFTGLVDGVYRVDAYAFVGADTCRAGVRSVSVRCARGPLNIRIKAVDATPTETDLLPRVGGGLGSLTLSVEELDGQDLSGYSYLWSEPTSTSATTSTATSTTLTARHIGEYKVTLTNGSDTLVAYTTLRAKPCKQVAHSYACGTTPAAPILDAGSATLSSLAPGDTIRTGDFDVIVTEVLGGGSGTWTGTGYTLISYLGENKIAVDFTDAGINDCYEYTGGGTVQSRFDASWGGVVSLDSLLGDQLNSLKKLSAEIVDLVQNNLSDSTARYNQAVTLVQKIRSEIADNTTLADTLKQQLLSKVDEFLACSQVNNGGARRARARVASTSCDLVAKADALQSYLESEAIITAIYADYLDTFQDPPIKKLIKVTDLRPETKGTGYLAVDKQGRLVKVTKAVGQNAGKSIGLLKALRVIGSTPMMVAQFILTPTTAGGDAEVKFLRDQQARQIIEPEAVTPDYSQVESDIDIEPEPGKRPQTALDIEDDGNKYLVYICRRNYKCKGEFKGVNHCLKYVGISTIDPALVIGSTGRYKSGDIQASEFTIIFNNLKKGEARGIEQAIINLNSPGLQTPYLSTQVDNLINSTARHRDVFDTRLQAGERKLNEQYPKWKQPYIKQIPNESYRAGGMKFSGNEYSNEPNCCEEP
ncbi:hypothetical protein [Spirosoma areae]